MRTMLVAGSFSRLLNEYELDIVNKEPLTLDKAVPYYRQTQPKSEQIIITDDGITGMDNYAVRSALAELLFVQEKESRIQPVRIITNRASILALNFAEVKADVHFYTRVPIQKYLNAISGKGSNAETKKVNRISRDEEKEEKENRQSAKKSIVERFRKKKNEEAEAPLPDREYEMIGLEISRVIAFTGHKGSGVTSTAVNLAQIANDRNLSTILIDLDTVNCALNLYFNEYYESAEKNKDIACSLIRNLAKPQNYDINSYHNNNMYVVTLAYSFSDKELLERFYTPAKLVNMLTVFRKHFQLCLLDMPMEALARLKECMLYIDTFGLCVSNNLYSLTSTLRGLQHAFTQEEMENLFGKSLVIVSKYNEQLSIQDEFFSPEKVCDLLLELCEAPLEREFELAGYVPFHLGFDSQLETDIPISKSDAYMEKAYSAILLRMVNHQRIMRTRL